MVSFLRTDSPLSRSIVSSFLQFLSKVEAAPGQDTEGIEVAAQCLAEVFGIGNHRPDDETRLVSLIDLFSSADGNEHAPSAPTTPVDDEPSQSRAVPSIGIPEESLVEQYKDGLELAGYFEGTTEGTSEYEEKVKQAKGVIEEARQKIRSTTSVPNWSKSYSEDTLVLAEAFKIQGNKTMSANQYHTAIQLYTLALSLCSNNAIFHSNRAAALTAVGKYEEAIADCHAAMKLDPLYSKAYSRLGLVYYAQGRLEDAIEKGFKKALELDPTSTSVQENLRAAQQKLEEQQRQRQSQQDSQGSGNQSASTGFDTTYAENFQLPPEIANLLPGLLNMVTQFNQGQQDGTPPQGSGNQSAGTGFNTASPANVQVPPEIADLLPGRFDVASRVSQRTAQSTEQSAGSNQGSGPDGRNQSGAGGNDHGAHQGEAEVTMDSSFNVSFNGQELPPEYVTMTRSALEQIFGGSGGWPPGNSYNSSSQQNSQGGSR